MGHRRQQPENRKADQKRVGDVAGGKPQGDTESVPLRPRKRLAFIEHPHAELMDPGERQLHLRLHTGDLRDPEPRGLTRCVPQ